MNSFLPYILFVLCLFVILTVSYFSYEDGTVVLIAPVPGHCLPFAFLFFRAKHFIFFKFVLFLMFPTPPEFEHLKISDDLDENASKHISVCLFSFYEGFSLIN